MSNSTENRLKSNLIINTGIIERMYTTCVQNLVCKYNHEFICYLCKTSDNDLISILKHVKTDGDHQERKIIKNIMNVMKDLQIDETKSIEIVLNSIIVTSVKQFYCIICTYNMASLEDVNNHIKDSRHMKTKTNMMNLVEPISLIYNCQTCYLALKSNAEFKYHKMFHLSPERHACCNIDIINFSIQEDKTRFIHCSVCDEILFSEEELERHVENITHRKWIDLLQRSKLFPLHDVAQHLINLDMNYSSTKAIGFTKSFYCYVCEVETLSPDNREHHISKKHRNKMAPLMENKKFESTSISVNCLPVYTCFICRLEFTEEKLLYKHYNSTVHQHRAKILYEFTSNNYINILQKSKTKSSLQCTLCNVEVTDPRTMLLHIFGSKHTKKIKKDVSLPVKVVDENMLKNIVTVIKSITRNDSPKVSITTPPQFSPSRKTTKENSSLSVKIIDKNENVIESITKNNYPIASVAPSQLSPDSENQSKFYCYICKTNVPDFMLIQHLKSKIHIRLLKITNNATASSGNKLFLCQTCEKSFSTDLQLIEHFRDGKHQDYDKTKISHKKIKNETDSIDNKSLENSFTPENANQNRHSDDLTEPVKIGLMPDKLVLESENKNQDNSFLNKDIKLRRPKKIFNLAEIGEKFIELCIESSSENIYNPDANSMYKMRLGITLSLPTKSERRYCIPCNEEMSSDLHTLNQHLHDESHESKILHMVAKDKPYSSSLNDYLNDFRLACSYMRKSSGNTVLCFACSTKIEDLDTSIYDHMKSKAHADNYLPLEASSKKIFQDLTKTWQNTWYFTEKFACDICSVKCDSEIDFVQHLMQDQHLENENQVPTDVDVLKSYICVDCATYYWHSKANFYVSHFNDSLHKRMLESQDFVVPPMIDSVQDIFNRLEDTIYSLVSDSDKVNEDAGKSLLKLLETITQTRYPTVKAYLFGSRFSRTNSGNGDFEIYLDCDNTYDDFTSAEKSRVRLMEVQKCLEKHEKVWSVEDVNLTTKIPTIKLQLKGMNSCCNIQCSNGLNVEKSKLIRFFVEFYPACRTLILLLKKWLSLCRLSGTEGITDYAASMLVIFYLQTEYILPSISHLIEQKNQSNFVAGWKTGFLLEKINLPRQKYPLKDHLSRFFNLYTEFNYITDVICPFLGRAVRKRDFVNFDKFPKEMNVYQTLYKNGKAGVFRFDSPMCVQDPIELSENLTGVVTKMQLRMFRQYCLESRKILIGLD